jgi:cyclopropane fatty-acyl-phospholipid synthase-like methyltransferase
METKEQVKIWEKDIDRRAAEVRARRILKIIQEYNPQAKEVLELGVGVGAVLNVFPEKYNLSGLDLQKEYVEVTKKLISRGKFYVQSMDKFKIDKKFDVIFSVHECINEVKPFKNWESTFRRVKTHLNSEGLFIFDMRTQKHLEDKKKQIVKLEKTPTGYIYDDFAVEKNKLIWKTTFFTKVEKGLYKLGEDSYFEEIYPIDKVKKSLSKYFKILKLIQFGKGQKAMFICRNDM